MCQSWKSVRTSGHYGSSADGTQNVTVWNIQNVLPVWVFEGGKRSPRGKKFTDTVLSSLFFSITYPSHHAIDMFFLKGFLTVADFLDFKYVRTWKSFNLEGWSDHGLEMMKPLSFDYCECHVMPHPHSFYLLHIQILYWQCFSCRSCETLLGSEFVHPACFLHISASLFWLKTLLTNAFAVVCLQTIQEFHLCVWIQMPPTVSINHFVDFQKPRACFEHSNFFKVNLPANVVDPGW